MRGSGDLTGDGRGKRSSRRSRPRPGLELLPPSWRSKAATKTRPSIANSFPRRGFPRNGQKPTTSEPYLVYYQLQRVQPVKLQLFEGAQQKHQVCRRNNSDGIRQKGPLRGAPNCDGCRSYPLSQRPPAASRLVESTRRPFARLCICTPNKGALARGRMQAGLSLGVRE